MLDSLFFVNQVIHDLETDSDYRILWISTSEDEPSYWLHLSGSSNVPEAVSLDDIAAGMEAGRYSFAPDLWRPTWRDSAGETAIRLRDRAWELIRPAVLEEPAIYDPKKRRSILLEIERNTGKDASGLYKHLGKYWRFGKDPDALLPDYSACGKSRDLFQDSAKRSGRRKAPGAAGKKLAKADLRNFQAALIRYHLGEDKLSLEKTYQHLIDDYYSVKDKDGNSVTPMDLDEIPSRYQFFYWHRKNQDILDAAFDRERQRGHQLTSSAETRRAETRPWGPGVACQIDAMTADVYLVSREDRTAIIGRPTVYFQMDSFSHMVTGMNISLDPPSWEDAVRTFFNSAEYKVDYCARYGIQITEAEWPCMHLPSVLLADRSIMESHTAGLLCKQLEITIVNAPPYRGDLKEIIAKHFHLIDMASLPEKAEVDFPQRDGKDNQPEAAFDLTEFTAIIIQCVLQYNNCHHLTAFQETQQMQRLHVKPIPRDIWNFGLRYMSGGFKVLDRAYVRNSLLSRGEGAITQYGILFDGRYYICEQAEREHWFDTARPGSPRKVTVSYDPTNAATIYVSPAEGAAPVECHLLARDSIYKGISPEEAAYDREEQAAYAPIEALHLAQLEKDIAKIMSDALKKRPKGPDNGNADGISQAGATCSQEKETIRKRNTAETLKQQDAEES